MRFVLSTLAVVLAVGCGPPKKPIVTDAGMEEDAGVDAGQGDAGRVAGTDPGNQFTQVVELPTGAAASTRVGLAASMVLDQFNQPVFAWVNEDPNGDTVKLDNTLFFTRWDGVAKKYETPKSIAQVGDVELVEPARPIQLARDGKTGRLGIVFFNDASPAQIRLATSDDEGRNWSLDTVATAATAPKFAALAMFDGTAHVSWLEGTSLEYRKKTGSGAWTPETVPAPGGTAAFASHPTSLALDASGAPGLSYFVETSGGPVTLRLWRPGTSTARDVSESCTPPGNIRPSVSLAFKGAQAALAYHLCRSASADGQLWFSADMGGTAFSTVEIPRTGTTVTKETTSLFQSLAFDSAGRVAIGANFSGNPAANPCGGGPKIARSNDGVAFTTCRPEPAGAVSAVGLSGQWISAAFHRPGKLTLGFTYQIPGNNSARVGIVLWRDP